MFSALAAVCTVDCAIEIVLITLHYITTSANDHYTVHQFDDRIAVAVVQLRTSMSTLDATVTAVSVDVRGRLHHLQ